MAVEKIFTNVFGSFTMKDEFELSAIWLSKPIHLPDGRKTVRITPGDLVTVIDNELVDSITSKCATHMILGCFGTLMNTDFKLTVIDIKTHEMLIVQL